MKILITGASGNIGRQLAKVLAANHQLVLLDRTAPSKSSANLETYRIDLTAPAKLASIFSVEKPDIVIHLAAILGAACESDPDYARKINIEAVSNIARLSSKNGVKKFIFTSTAAVYNQSKLVPTDELSNIDPQTVYGKTKLAAEAQLRDISKNSVMQFSIFRVFNVYGKGVQDSLIFKLLNSDTQNPAELCDPANHYRDFVHINDVIAAFTSVIANNFSYKFDIFNIASGRSLSTVALIELLKGHKANLHYLVKGKCEPSFSWADITKAKQQLQFKPSQSLMLN